MGQKSVDESLTPEEWEVAHRIVDAVRKNDLGTEIIIYFENDFSAVNDMNSLKELSILPPMNSASLLGLVKKKMVSIKFRHGDEVLIIKLNKEIFTAINAGLDRGIDSLP